MGEWGCQRVAGKVFISCGQSSERERKTADRIKKLLKEKFDLESYLAVGVQSLNDIMRITDELRSSDYYLFIDFVRNNAPCISVFSHQELALAHHLGFSDIIVLQEKGAPREGFLRYLQANPITFDNDEELISKIEVLVQERKWSCSYSRNLVIEQLGFSEVFQYTDHTGSFLEVVWRVRVHNRRPDVAAVGSVCILDYLEQGNGGRVDIIDRSYLKWAGQAGYDRTILPKDYGDIDLFATHLHEQGIFLHSLRDTPRAPIVVDNDRYRLFFKLFSRGFKIVEFSVELELAWEPLVTPDWQNRSICRLL